MADASVKVRKAFAAAADNSIEEAVLGIVFLSRDVARLEQLERYDFASGLHVFFLVEWQMMHQAGLPFGDAIAFSRWMRRPTTLRRLSEGKVGMKREDVMVEFAEICRRHVDRTAQLPYYLRCLASERLRRALAVFGNQLLERIAADPDGTAETIAWSTTRLERITKKAKEIACP